MSKQRPLLAAIALLAAACSAPPAPQEPAPPPLLPVGRSAARNATGSREPQLTRLENGLAVVTTSASPGRDAQIQLGLLAGTVMMAPGLGELAAHVLAECGDPSQGRLPLVQAIARLGGTLKVHAGPVTTWFDVRIPGARWPEALTALREALDQPPRSRNQIERIREELIERRRAEVQADPIGAMAHRMLLADASTASNLTDLVDRDASEVDAYISRLFRPERMLLALEAPDAQERMIATLSKAGPGSIGSWRPAATIPGDMPLLDRRFEPGLHWAKGPGTGQCQVAIAMLLPDPARSESAPLFVLQECVTLDGTGGRFEQLQRDQGLGHLRWRSDLVQSPDAAALLLRTEATPEEALALFRTLNLARASMLDVPPTPSELGLALRRAPLTVRLGMLDSGARLRSQTQMLVRGSGLAAIDAAFAQIERSGFEVDVQAQVYLKLPVAMIVVGGEVPAGATDVREFDLLPSGLAVNVAATANTTADDSSAASGQWLDRAMAAVGSKSLLGELVGWQAESLIRHADAPPMRERIVWQDEGWLERDRELLGQRLEARITAEARFERLGDTRRPLEEPEVATMRREQQRHPLALLAAHARGTLEFRSRARRAVGDREMMVLEAISPRFDRLRIHIDTQSFLIRVVEVWETLPGGAVVHIEDAWSDYRRVGDLRVPHHRMTSQDNGLNRVETVVESWVTRRR